MEKNKGWITLVGFILAGTGFLTLALSLVGVKLAGLLWLDAGGAGLGFLLRLLMILLGMILIYLGKSNFSGE